jgi:hypothetical protein
MAPERPTMVIGRIENPGDDHINLYPKHFDHYHVNATAEEAQRLHIGDTIRYEPTGRNHGVFVSKIVLRQG